MDTALNEIAGNDPGKPESLSNRWRHAANRVLARVWPHKCFVCGEASGASAVCASCEPGLPVLPVDVCPVCALPSPERQRCGRCLQKSPHFDASLGVFMYDQPVREMVLAIKHGQGFGLVPWLADQLVCCMEGVRADCIVPMPLHRKRLAQRGFNQSVEVGRALSRRIGIPLLLQSVVRDVPTPVLAGLRVKERRRALRGAFRAEADFTGKRVLVLDDVMTSGSTLDELARTLKQRGAAHVTNLVMARTLRKPRK